MFIELCQLNECRPYELANRIRQNRQLNVGFIKNLSTILVNYHRAKRPAFEIIPNDIGWRGAESQMAFGRNRLRITVEQFVFCSYKRTLRYPELPCIVQLVGGSSESRRNGGNHYHRNFYPIEYLYISDCNDMDNDNKDFGINSSMMVMNGDYTIKKKKMKNDDDNGEEEKELTELLKEKMSLDH